MPSTPRMYPLWLRVADRWCVVVGGGQVAARKAAALVDCGARVRMVSPDFLPELQHRDDLQRVPEPFQPHHLDGALLVIAATDDPRVNAAVARHARRLGVLVNVVDEPDLCDFIVPAVVSRGDLTLAVCTHGASPTLARRLKDELADRYDQAYGQLAALLAEVRPMVHARFQDPARRRQVFDALSDPGWLDRLRTDGFEAVEQAMRQWIQAQH